MIVLCKGEGPSDIGRSTEPVADLRDNYGAMGALVLQMVQACRELDEHEYDEYKIVSDLCIDVYKDRCPVGLGYLSKSKQVQFKGAKHKEIYFQKEARCFGFYAKEHEKQGDVVAVLFHDADSSHANDVSAEKRKAIYLGFESADFHKGVAMLPNPTSEAWVLLMLDNVGYRRLVRNTKDRERLKREVADELGRRKMDVRDMYDMIRNGEFSSENLRNDESFADFKQRLCEVLYGLRNHKCFDCDSKRN